MSGRSTLVSALMDAKVPRPAPERLFLRLYEELKARGEEGKRGGFIWPPLPPPRFGPEPFDRLEPLEFCDSLDDVE